MPPKWLLVPPKEKLCPPSEDCAPKKLTGSGLLECISRTKLVFATGIFVIFVDWHRISWHFWHEDLFFLFFLEITCFRPGKVFKFLILAGKSLWISVKTFFWRSPVFGRKSRLNFWFRPKKPSEFLVFTFYQTCQHLKMPNREISYQQIQ